MTQCYAPTNANPQRQPLQFHRTGLGPARRRDQVGLQRPAGTTERRHGSITRRSALWPSVEDLAKTLRCEKPEWWATVDWEMLDNGRIRLATALQRWSQCRKGKPEWHQSGSCGFPWFHRRGNRKAVSFSSHVGDGRRVQWQDQRHITLPRIGTLTLAEPLPEVGWVKQVHAVREGGRW